MITALQVIAFRVAGMRMKLAAIVVVIGIALALAATLRTSSRADAAPGDCYSDAKGPAEPTICS